jgi:hypothetical protein
MIFTEGYMRISFQHSAGISVDMENPYHGRYRNEVLPDHQMDTPLVRPIWRVSHSKGWRH